jgi:error-prone DNA polymerase
LEGQEGKYRAVRLGFRLVEGLSQNDILLLLARRLQPYKSVRALQEAGLSQTTLERLADADAFRSMGIDRRDALWQVAALQKEFFVKTPKGKPPVFEGRALTLFEDQDEKVSLPVMTDAEHVIQDYASMSLSLKAHPLSFVRDNLRALGVSMAAEQRNLRNGQYIKAAGLVLVRQRPGTASGVCFITLEDESGTFNLVVWRDLFEQYRKQILGAKLLMVEGNLQIEGEVVHVIVQRCHNLNPLLGQLTASHDEDVFPGGRNFK